MIAGATIQGLAASRRRQAYVNVLSAVACCAIAAWLWSRLPIAGASCALLALVLASRGAHLWQRAKNASLGATGETELQALLLPLVTQGWQLAVNVTLAGYGDVDALLYSPSRRWYVIDAKMHGGAVVLRGDTLMHMRGQEVTAFDEDFVDCALRQAHLVAQRVGAPVFPLLCFMQARLLPPLPGAVRGVAVVDARSVVAAIGVLEGT